MKTEIIVIGIVQRRRVIKMEFFMFMFNVMIAFMVGGVIYHFIERMFDND